MPTSLHITAVTTMVTSDADGIDYYRLVASDASIMYYSTSSYLFTELLLDALITDYLEV